MNHINQGILYDPTLPPPRILLFANANKFAFFLHCFSACDFLACVFCQKTLQTQKRGAGYVTLLLILLFVLIFFVVGVGAGFFCGIEFVVIAVVVVFVVNVVVVGNGNGPVVADALSAPNPGFAKHNKTGMLRDADAWGGGRRRLQPPSPSLLCFSKRTPVSAIWTCEGGAREGRLIGGTADLMDNAARRELVLGTRKCILLWTRRKKGNALKKFRDFKCQGISYTPIAHICNSELKSRICSKSGDGDGGGGTSKASRSPSVHNSFQCAVVLGKNELEKMVQGENETHQKTATWGGGPSLERYWNLFHCFISWITLSINLAASAKVCTKIIIWKYIKNKTNMMHDFLQFLTAIMQPAKL